MRDLDQLLSPATGRDLGERAGDAADVGDVDALTGRGLRRGRRHRALALAGVAAATALAVGVGSQVIGDQLGAEEPAPGESPTPSDPPSEDATNPRPRDLTAEQVARLPEAVVEQAVVGADLDHRAVVWRAGNRSVLARTTDGGETWEYSGEPGEYVEVTPAGGESDVFWVSVSRGLRERSEELVDETGALLPVTEPDGLGPVAEGELLALHLPRPNAERQVAVAPDGSSHYWPGDPFYGEQSTGVVGAWAFATVSPTGRIVQQVAGPEEDYRGRCCMARSVVRWSDDGGTRWTTHELDDLGADPDAIYGFSRIIPSLDPETVAVHESTEGTGRTVLGTQRLAADGSGGERFDDQFPVEVDSGWSAVLPDGELLVWVAAPDRLGGPWRSEGQDWGTMRRDEDLAPPGGIDAAGLELVDVRLVDGAPRLVAIAPSGAMLVVEGDEVSWTSL